MTAVEHTLTKSFPADPMAVPEIRREVVDLAAAVGVSGEQLESIRLAVSEAVTNVVIHAYRWRPGRIYVTAAAVSDELWVLIGDSGCGMNALTDSPGLGLGLLLISQECDDFTIVSRAAGGTEVRMRFDLVGVSSEAGDQALGSDAAAWRPASARFSTTT